MKSSIFRISVLFGLSTLSLALGTTHAYFFGLKSSDNTITNIQNIEKKYKLHIPIISFIFDPRGGDAENTISHLAEQLGADRIYHITISPNSFSAKEVSSGAFDEQYKKVFQLIKKYDLKVIFRTMHEMNGGRYPRGSDPAAFKKARIHVRKLSRQEGLDQQNILFDMSVNHRDMPSRGAPSQTARLIQCKISTKEENNCSTFEDYYPGDTYVDIMGVSFYNRGKASYDRARISPDKIVNQHGRNTLSRLKSFSKPIFIDEVATTAVRYEGKYNSAKSKQVYATENERKNKRILQLRELMRAQPKIVGLIYFNVDYTNGLSEKFIGEADRSAINLEKNKTYNAIFDLYKGGEKLERDNQLVGLFDIKLTEIQGEKLFVKSSHIGPIKELIKNLSGSINILTAEKLKNKYKRFSDEDLNEIIQETKKLLE